MSIFNERKDSPGSIDETVATFTNLAGSLVAKGDIAGVNRLAVKTYLEMMKGCNRHSLEEMRVREAMGQALQEVFTRGARQRRRYFETYRVKGWRTK